MIDALGTPQSLLLLGGTSDIALAVARTYAQSGPLRVVLAARPSARRDAAVAELEALGCRVEALDFDARAPHTHAGVVAAAAAGGDLDVSVVAYGVLGDNEQAWTDVDAAVELAEVNYVGPVATGVALAAQVRKQGHGVVVALSSVAGERPAAPTSSTAPPRPASTPSTPGWGKLSGSTEAGWSSYGRDSSARR
jgi:decaprenylphospho-beta-D-erythro-pentofuranosid-2-ulose 2-reductase